MDTSDLEKIEYVLYLGSTHMNQTMAVERKSRKQCDKGIDRGSESQGQEKG